MLVLARIASAQRTALAGPYGTSANSKAGNPSQQDKGSSTAPIASGTPPSYSPTLKTQPPPHHDSWCPASPQLFALSPLSPLSDATIHIYNTAYAQSTPRELVLRPRPHRVRDFDWLGAPATNAATASGTATAGATAGATRRGAANGTGSAHPRFAAAIGRNVLVVQVGPEETTTS